MTHPHWVVQTQFKVRLHHSATLQRRRRPRSSLCVDQVQDWRSFDDQKPSLFEVLSEQQLNSLLPPTLRYLLTVATHRHPRYLLRVLNSFDELYALLMLIVERHYLRTRGGAFTENFYGLKRRRRPVFETERAKAAVGGMPPEEKLRDREIWRSLVFLVGLPYLRAKAQDYFEALGGGIDHDVLDETAVIGQQRILSEQVGFPSRVRSIV